MQMLNFYLIIPHELFFSLWWLGASCANGTVRWARESGGIAMLLLLPPPGSRLVSVALKRKMEHCSLLLPFSAFGVCCFLPGGARVVKALGSCFAGREAWDPVTLVMVKMKLFWNALPRSPCALRRRPSTISCSARKHRKVRLFFFSSSLEVDKSLWWEDFRTEPARGPALWASLSRSHVGEVLEVVLDSCLVAASADPWRRKFTLWFCRGVGL